MLTCQEPTQILSWETEEEEDSFDEDEMDFLLFTRLEDAREVMFQILRERRLDIRQRMTMVEMLAEKMQQCVDECRDYEIDDVIIEAEEALREACNAIDLSLKDMMDKEEDSIPDVYSALCREFTVFKEMELLRDEWGQTLDHMWSVLYAGGREQYEELCCRFDRTYGCDSKYREDWQRIGEQLMMFFVYTYFCGAVYDEWIATKIRMATFSVRWIQELVRYRWWENGEKLTMEDVIQMSWRYAREVEHSDENLGILEEWLQGE